MEEAPHSGTAQPHIEAALQNTSDAIQALISVDHGVEVDDDAISEADSGYSEAALSTASITSSVFDYEEEYGRSYHAFRRGKYVMPNDLGEQERQVTHKPAFVYGHSLT